MTTDEYIYHKRKVEQGFRETKTIRHMAIMISKIHISDIESV